MKYFLLWVSIIVLFTNCKSNNNSPNETPDSLSKYSYPLILFGDSTGHATGFFIKNKKRIFLVSNYHVFTGQNTIKKIKTTSNYKTLNFSYTIKKNLKKLCTINLVDIAYNSNSYYFYEHPDIYCYDVTDKLKDGFVNSIEKFMTPLRSKNEASIDMFAIGYTFKNETFIEEIVHFKPIYTIYDTIQMSSGPPDNKIVTLKNSYYLGNQSIGGMSGAPVFYQYSNGIMFGGVISSHFKSSNTTLIVKPIEVLKTIDSLQKR